MIAPVPVEVAWQVLTDFDHMARFIPNLERSAVMHRAGNRLRIEQQGKAYFGPFSMAFGSTRDVELMPMREVRARQVTGTAKSMESSMRFSAVPEGTRLDYRADIIPDIYLPPLFGPSTIRREMADQFSAILNEMRLRAATEKR
jgi:carbon monoxide dehydrogenase subunit G